VEKKAITVRGTKNGRERIVHEHIVKYTNKLLRDRTAVPESIRFYVLDERVTTNHEDQWLPVFTEVFQGLDVTALLFARLSLPFADLLIERADPAADRLVPNDSETRGFLHDLPFIRKGDWSGRPGQEFAAKIIRRLKERKAVIVQGLGVIATGGVTVEQAFIGFSTVYHTTFVKYLLDLLVEGIKLPEERAILGSFRSTLAVHAEAGALRFAAGPIRDREEIIAEICRVGRYTVEQGYVDSFFGNISYFDGKTIFISQTTSSLDELEGFIDPVPLDGSSTAGLSASSELPAHRGIYVSSDYHAVLHGHPRFSVIMSMFCEEEGCGIGDCNRLCDRKRSACGVPIVAGETGAGGLAKSVPPALRDTGVCLVFGHGIFAAGKRDFQDAFLKMAQVENRCREEYFRLLDERTK
jgi:ribulose-5-phosphate 4-epimerase/fuculose-1-phosphate aldolase